MKPCTPVPTTALALALVALGSCSEPVDEPSADSDEASGAPAADVTDRSAPTERLPIDPTTVGSVVGVVRFAGTPPKRPVLDLKSQPGCHEGHDEPPRSEFMIVGADGGLENVLVHVKSGLEGWEISPAEPDEVVLNQSGCVYRPHVTTLRTGQTLRVHNGDPTNHNVNARARKNQSFNQTQPPDGADLEVVFEHAEVVPFQCDIHPWMKAHVAVYDHPFYAVSDAEGRFRIDGLPPGEYELEAVHPDNSKIGKRGKLRATATVPASGEVEVEFTF